MTTLKITMTGISESLKVRCNLSEATSPIEVDYLEGHGWQGTQWQAANTRHTTQGLADIGHRLLAEALQEPEEAIETEYAEV